MATTSHSLCPSSDGGWIASGLAGLHVVDRHSDHSSLILRAEWREMHGTNPAMHEDMHGAAAKGHDAFITDKIALYKAKGVGYAWWEYYANDGVFSMVTCEGGAWKPWVEKLR
jgi:hypothetical protein